MVGFIKIHRRIKQWEWYSESYMVHLFVHLVIGAYWEDKTYKGILYKRGQVTTGRKKLSLETGISQQKIRTGLSRLERSGEIATKTTNRFTLITICNYDEYQPSDKAKQPADNQQITNKQPADNQQITTVKEVKKKKNVRTFTPPTLEDVGSYFLEKGYTKQSGEKAFNYYDSNNWKDGNGKKVKNWKQKMIGVWFKDENKIKENNSSRWE